MIWEAFGRGGKMELQCVGSRMNAVGYQRMLSNANVREKGRDFCGVNWIFMQDNGPIHKARSTREWVEEEIIDVLEWLACSPELNPIENLWGVLARKVFAHGRQFQITEELKTEIFDAWDAIPNSALHALVDSMPNIIFDVINKNGCATRYQTKISPVFVNVLMNGPKLLSKSKFACCKQSDKQIYVTPYLYNECIELYFCLFTTC